jgi:tRNA dimethylallyltransferase
MGPAETADHRPPVAVLCGPTACGKTALALRLARYLPIEIISADSRQIYRGMDIGTAKPTPDELAAAPHHLIDVADPDEPFTAADFVGQGREALTAIRSRGHLPLVVGGTGLYILALLEGLADVPGGDARLRSRLLCTERKQGEGTLHKQLQRVDPCLARRVPPRDLVRIVRGLEVFISCGRRLSDMQREHAAQPSPYRVLSIGLTMEREVLYDRIARRVERMLGEGLVAEVEDLLGQGFVPELKALQTIGYREIIQYLRGMLSKEEAIELVRRDTRRYAKRQLTWFRKTKSIIWLDSLGEFAKVRSLIDRFFNAA